MKESAMVTAASFLLKKRVEYFDLQIYSLVVSVLLYMEKVGEESMRIRVLLESDALVYQALRLIALKINPEAFGSTYEREIKFPIETVIERIKPTIDKFVLGAFDDKDMLVGIVTFMRETSIKTDHKGNVYGLFVAQEMRRQGLGKSLMLELLSKARDYNGLEQINLTVVSENQSAKKLYESLGFEVYGIERNALKFNGKYYDEDLMVLIPH